MNRRVLSLLLLIGGCSEAPSTWPIAFDLVAGLGVADEWSETRKIDLVTPRGRRHLVSGWSEDRWDRQRQRGFVVNEESDAVLGFDIIEPRPMVLRFLAAPIEQEAETPVDVEVLINGNPAGTLLLDGRPRRYRIPVTDGLLRVGGNKLTLRDPGRAEATDPLVRWYQIELQFNDESEPPRPRLVGEDGALMIPYGTRVEYTLMLPAQGLLTVDRLLYVGEAGGSLSVTLEEDGKEPTELSLPTEISEAVLDKETENALKALGYLQ